MRSDHKYIVMEGNPFDGYTFHGVFDDIEEANEWGDKNCNWEWYSVRINPVKDGGYYWSTDAKSVMKGWK